MIFNDKKKQLKRNKNMANYWNNVLPILEYKWLKKPENTKQQ